MGSSIEQDELDTLNRLIEQKRQQLEHRGPRIHREAQHISEVLPRVMHKIAQRSGIKYEEQIA